MRLKDVVLLYSRRQILTVLEGKYLTSDWVLMVGFSSLRFLDESIECPTFSDTSANVTDATLDDDDSCKAATWKRVSSWSRECHVISSPPSLSLSLSLSFRGGLLV